MAMAPGELLCFSWYTLYAEFLASHILNQDNRAQSRVEDNIYVALNYRVTTLMPFLSLQTHCYPTFLSLTAWGWMAHICVRRKTIIVSDNGFAATRWQAIKKTMLGYC